MTEAERSEPHGLLHVGHIRQEGAEQGDGRDDG